MRKSFFVILSFFLFNSSTFSHPSYKVTAQLVLDKLYKANGNQIYLKPTLVLTDDDVNAALFLRRSNKIELSKKAFRVCQSMGEDSLSALAFILGHELAHAYQHDLGTFSTSFLAYDRHNGSSLKHEELADVQGVFISYLAGFKTIEILPETIKKIYTAFNLPNDLEGYPTLLERQHTTAKVQKMAEELIQIYEAGNYLLSIGQYELAIASFEYIEEWYKGKEVYNNLGVSYAWYAMNFTEKNIDPYLYPFEVNWTTRMKKPLGNRGENDLTPIERERRKSYLKNAKENFKIVAKMSPQFIVAELNMLCLLILEGNYEEAISFFNRNELSKKASFNYDRGFSSQLGDLVMALAYFKSGKEEQALRIWNKIAKSNNQVLAFQAAYNLKVYACETIDINESLDCESTFDTQQLIDNVKLHRTRLGEFFISLRKNEVQLSITPKNNSLLYTYKKNGRHFSLQRIFSPTQSTLEGFTSNTLITNSGSISTCEKQKVAFLKNPNGNIQEWAKYY